ncbi:MAG: hypothetical protein HRT86_05835 [Ilumatobacteraceae bacterium]|nr:hypothetical protein [Ilumatobacteraceae bacterium]
MVEWFSKEIKMQPKPTPEECKTCERVLQFFHDSISEHESYAVMDIKALRHIIDSNTFDPRDYEAVSDKVVPSGE